MANENSAKPSFSKIGFFKTFVLPTFWVFLIPAIGLAFFLHAQAKFDGEARQAMLDQVRADKTMSPEDREQTIKTIEQVPFSTMMRNPEFAQNVQGEVKFNYTTFRWMIRLSAISIILGVLSFMLMGFLVLISLISQRTQYASLWVGWNVTRFFSAYLVIVQGALLIALSYWVTALWANRYYPKLILIAGLVGIGAIWMVLVAIFKNPKHDFSIEGAILLEENSPKLWDDLRNICDKVGTAPPDQIVAGIDDNFFVTELPVRVDGKQYHGRTLFVSLSLLKQLKGSEADAVLAHEMAHFSGSDTAFSKKVAPLMNRYDNYLKTLRGCPKSRIALD